MTDGEVRKVDEDNRKITIKRGNIKNVDRPGMTVVLQAKDPAMLEGVKADDKIRFHVETSARGFAVPEREASK